MFPPSAPCARIVVAYGSDERLPFTNILYFQPDSDIASADVFDVAVALATEFDTAVHPPLKAWLAADSGTIGIGVHVYSHDGVVGSHAIGNAEHGTTDGDTEPDYVAAVIRKHTLSAGRPGRGRVFVGCVAEENTDTSILTTDGRAALTALADVYFGDHTAATFVFKPAHWDRKDGAFREIVHHAAQGVLQTQRRRRFRSPL